MREDAVPQRGVWQFPHHCGLEDRNNLAPF
jgi:hypothetical protein